MAGDGQHISEYDPRASDAILGEAAHLLRGLGFAADHAILIGGLVPGLLVLDPGPGRPQHVGTADLDFCLSVALVEGDTAEYERIETALRNAGYQPGETSACWVRSSGMPMQVEFFCPACEERPAGSLFRPKAAAEPRAKHNLGSRLSAIALEAGAAISADVETVERDVELPDGAGQVRQRFRVTGLTGFLVAKIGALTGRDKPKDAYDVVWLLESWPGGPEGAGGAAQESAAFARADVRSALDRLSLEFGSVDRVGCRSYARFTARPGASADDMQRLALQAAGAVAAFTAALRRA